MRHVYSAYLRQGIGLSAVFALIMALVSAVVIGAPVYQRHLFEEETAHAVGNMAAISRALHAEETVASRGVSLPTVPLAEDFAELSELSFPPVVAGVVGTGQVSVSTKDPHVLSTEVPMPASLNDRALAFIADTEALAAVTFIRGAAPGPNSIEVDAREIEDDAELLMFMARKFAEDHPPVEIALSTANAQVLGLDVGDELAIGGLTGMTHMVVSGVFEPVDPDALVWQVHLRALNPFIDDDPNSGKTALGAALANPDTPGWIGWSAQAVTTRVRIPVDPVSADPDALAADLLEFISARHEVSPTLDPVEFTSSLATTFSSLIAQRATARVVLHTITTGPLGATLAVGALMSLVSRHRRRAAHTIMLARGASSLQMRILGAVHGGIIGLPALAVGLALGAPRAGAAMALIPAAALALAPMNNPGSGGRGSGKWRSSLVWAAAASVLALTGAAIYASSRGESDPLSIALPILLAASIAIVALAIIPLLMHPLHRLAARSRGLTAFLGSARATRESRAGWPVLTLVVALGAAIFTSTTLATVEMGARTNAFQGVGADIRLSTGWLSPEDQVQIAALPGVEAAAAINRRDSTQVGTPETHRRATVLVVDTAELARAQVNLPGAVDLTVLADAGSDAIPVITSPGLLSDTDGPAVHLGEWLPLEVRGELPAVPGVSSEGVWIIIDSSVLPESAWKGFSPPRLMLLATDGTTDTAERVQALTGGVMTTPLAELEAFASSPVVDGLAVLAWWSVVLSALLAALGVVLFLTLAAPDRTYVNAIIATLGGRVGAGLSAWEVLPVVLAGIGGGLTAGFMLPRVLSLDLSVFTGASEVALVTDGSGVAAIITVMTVVIAAGVVAGSLIGTRRRARALRIGE